MSDQSSRNLLVVILLVSAASLTASVTQLALTLHGTSLRGATNLPARFTDGELRRIAAGFTDPYNVGDADFIYNSLDDGMKAQVGRDRVIATLGRLRAAVGNIDSASYEGFRELPHDWDSPPRYQLNYRVRLSGRGPTEGTLHLSVVDKPSGPTLVGFSLFSR